MKSTLSLFKSRTGLLTLLIMVFSIPGVGQQPRVAPPGHNAPAPLVTFVELGSVKCVPCRMMQPVMRSVESRYGSQIKVVFYDIWKDDQKKFAVEYGVRVIPTQVFLDKNGREIFRHEGFFPEAEIDQLLQRHGLRSKANS